MLIRRLILIGSALTIVVVYLVYQYVNRPGEAMNIQEVPTQILEEFEQVTALEEEAHAWIHTANFDATHLPITQRDWLEMYKEPLKVVEYFFATILLEDEDMFVQAFAMDNIINDLYMVDNPDKMEVTREMMNRVSRNQTIAEVGFLSEKRAINSKKATVDVRIFYTDNQSVRITLDMELIGTHHEQNDEIFFITSSIWDIIEKIESL